jgi:hypothetical protein
MKGRTFVTSIVETLEAVVLEISERDAIDNDKISLHSVISGKLLQYDDITLHPGASPKLQDSISRHAWSIVWPLLALKIKVEICKENLEVCANMSSFG